MKKYIVKADIMGEGNPEYAPDKELRNGMECDGFLLLTWKDGKPHSTVVQNLTVMDMAQIIAHDDSQAGSAVAQAIAIAEGIRKARKICKEFRTETAAREIAEMLRSK